MHLSTEAIAKSACLCVTAIGMCLAMVPPQPKPPQKCREKYNAPPAASDGEGRSAVAPPWFDFEAAIATFCISYFPYLLSIWMACISALDIIHALDLFQDIMPVAHTMAARTINTQLIIGFVLTIPSSAFRFSAFQTMGKLFTYHLAILPDHKLITHEVYAYCRHPSYTAISFIYVGVLLTTTAPGSVLYDHLGVDSTRKLMTVLGLAAARGSYEFMCRAEVEDQVLRREFGDEWEEWACKVPYKFIPYLI